MDLSGGAVGSSVELKAYNAGQVFGFPGGELGTTGQFGSLLNNKDFTMLKITIGAAIANAITSIPKALVNNTYWTINDAKVTKATSVTGGQPGPPPGTPFSFDHKLFSFSRMDNTVTLDDTVRWTVMNNRIFGHSFHIHDVMFNIVARNGSAANVGNWEQGWKDLVYLPLDESVTFVAKFDDYADTSHPFMYHCHFGNHEDEGMMGQFIVVPPVVSSVESETGNTADYSLYPNPTSTRLFISMVDPLLEVYYVSVHDANGRAVLMLPQPELAKGIDVSALARGTYYVRLTDKKTKSHSVRVFQKQ